MKPYKLTGYTKLYGELNITGKNGYEEHKKALARLTEMGYKVSKWDELEKEAGITPPKPKAEPHTEEEIKEITEDAGAPDMDKDIKEDLTEIAEKEAEQAVEEVKETAKEVVEKVNKETEEIIKEAKKPEEKTITSISKDKGEKKISKEELIKKPKKEEEVDWSV